MLKPLLVSDSVSLLPRGVHIDFCIPSATSIIKNANFSGWEENVDPVPENSFVSSALALPWQLTHISRKGV